MIGTLYDLICGMVVLHGARVRFASTVSTLVVVHARRGSCQPWPPSTVWCTAAAVQPALPQSSRTACLPSTWSTCRRCPSLAATQSESQRASWVQLVFTSFKHLGTFSLYCIVSVISFVKCTNCVVGGQVPWCATRHQ